MEYNTTLPPSQGAQNNAGSLEFALNPDVPLRWEQAQKRSERLMILDRSERLMILDRVDKAFLGIYGEAVMPDAGECRVRLNNYLTLLAIMDSYMSDGLDNANFQFNAKFEKRPIT